MKNREEKRIQATDCVLVLLLVLSLLGVGFRWWRARHPETDGKAVAVRMLWQDADSRTVDCLQPGEMLQTEAGAVFGEVLKIERFPVERELDAGGETVRGAAGGDPRCNAWVTVAVTLSESDGMLRRENGQPLPLGASYVLFADRIRAVLTVSELEKKNIKNNSY